MKAHAIPRKSISAWCFDTEDRVCLLVLFILIVLDFLAIVLLYSHYSQ
jgi:hypothetical protein